MGWGGCAPSSLGPDRRRLPLTPSEHEPLFSSSSHPPQSKNGGWAPSCFGGAGVASCKRGPAMEFGCSGEHPPTSSRCSPTPSGLAQLCALGPAAWQLRAQWGCRDGHGDGDGDGGRSFPEISLAPGLLRNIVGEERVVVKPKALDLEEQNLKTQLVPFSLSSASVTPATYF